MIIMLIYLLAGHFFLDVINQGDFVAIGKNSKMAHPNTPWWFLMFAHAFVHAAFVFFVTQSLICFMGELIVHYATDTVKCRGKLTFLSDQIIHIFCKFVWVGVVAYTVL